MPPIIKKGHMACTGSGEEPRPDSFHSVAEWQGLIADTEKATRRTTMSATAELADGIYGKPPLDAAARARQANVGSLDAIAEKVYGAGPDVGQQSPDAPSPTGSVIPDKVVAALDPRAIYKRYNGK